MAYVSSSPLRVADALSSMTPRPSEHTKARRFAKLCVRASSGEDDFEARLAKLRKKGGSGTGKKAEERKSRKEGVSSEAVPGDSPASTKRVAIESLPPVPLTDPIADGLPVVVGFSPYSERLNGKFALLGLVALLSVELASGEAFLKYHDGATIGVQLYVLAGLGALFVKFEKEKESILPK